MALNNYHRTGIAALALSAAGLVHISMQEGFVEVAAPPVKGDVPTYGFGTTEGVKLGDKITPEKALKRELPVRQRDDWEEWLAARRAEHAQRTAEIVRLETQLNARVYTLFDLTAAEIRLIEADTKYRYGEV